MNDRMRVSKRKAGQGKGKGNGKGKGKGNGKGKGEGKGKGMGREGEGKGIECVLTCAAHGRIAIVQAPRDVLEVRVREEAARMHDDPGAHALHGERTNGRGDIPEAENDEILEETLEHAGHSRLSVVRHCHASFHVQ